ncbi:hypothetical protein niasHS_005641 [Heterodera schachtii]|uniref:Uncharacterized protein n=1 Tax=Heterodera schachtii TaxID=97005 RepID=A0ABD2JZ15_HETSC
MNIAVGKRSAPLKEDEEVEDVLLLPPAKRLQQPTEIALTEERKKRYGMDKGGEYVTVEEEAWLSDAYGRRYGGTNAKRGMDSHNANAEIMELPAEEPENLPRPRRLLFIKERKQNLNEMRARIAWRHFWV